MSIHTLQQGFIELVATFGREQVFAALRSTLYWGLLGGAAGLAFSFILYRGFRHFGWYGATSSAGRWGQRGILAFVTLVCGTLGLAVGLCEGGIRQSHLLLTQSQLAKATLLPLTDELADGLAWLDLAVQRDGLVPQEKNSSLLQEFRTGKRELDAPAFLQRIDSVKADLFQELLVQLEGLLKERLPKTMGGMTEKIIHRAIHNFGTALLEQKLSSELQHHGVDQIYLALRDRLVAEAALSGNPTTISRKDLSAFLLREGVLPAIMRPIRSFARQQQIICLLLAMLVGISPALICRIFRQKPLPSSGHRGQ